LSWNKKLNHFDKNFIRVKQMDALHCLMLAAALPCTPTFIAEGPLTTLEPVLVTNLVAVMIHTVRTIVTVARQLRLMPTVVKVDCTYLQYNTKKFAD